MSDHQQDMEWKCQKRLRAALAEMRLAIEEVNTLSACVTIKAHTFEEWVHDEIPTELGWGEKINAARRG